MARENYLEKLRTDNDLPKPIDFEKSRITSFDVERLLLLLREPFPEEEIEITKGDNFTSRNVKVMKQIDRVQKVFGSTHVNFLYDREVDKLDSGYLVRMGVEIQIGNHTDYEDSNGIPGSKFIPCFSAQGVGFSTCDDLKTAEKSARTDGIKHALKIMGIMRDDYLKEYEIDDTLDYDYTEVTISGDVKFSNGKNANNKIFFLSDAIDNTTGEKVQLVLFKENKMNKNHDNIKKFLSKVKKGDIYLIGYTQKLYNSTQQYLIQDIKNKGEK
ncbi:MAG: hypothetical protein N4A40_13190 [Tissierellales bacterium]|jgi:hypothetical protein|nr:hypothetical protein [Tissierellales bacterium]